MNFAGLLIGISTFLIIGLFHPLVIKVEYHWGTKPWWVFLLAGIGGIAISMLVENVVISSLSGVFAFSSLWTIKELFEQQKNVDNKVGWVISCIKENWAGVGTLGSENSQVEDNKKIEEVDIDSLPR